MEATRCIIVLGIGGLIAFGACSKDESDREKGSTRSAAVNDSIVNDKTLGGGITIIINEEWKGDTMIHF